MMSFFPFKWTCAVLGEVGKKRSSSPCRSSLWDFILQVHLYGSNQVWLTVSFSRNGLEELTHLFLHSGDSVFKAEEPHTLHIVRSGDCHILSVHGGQGWQFYHRYQHLRVLKTLMEDGSICM